MAIILEKQSVFFAIEVAPADLSQEVDHPEITLPSLYGTILKRSMLRNIELFKYRRSNKKHTVHRKLNSQILL